MKSYFIGKHDFGTLPDILLVIEHKGVYELPFSYRTYREMGKKEFLELVDIGLAVRCIEQC